MIRTGSTLALLLLALAVAGPAGADDPQAAGAEAPAAAGQAPEAGAWRDDWEVAEGFAIDVDSRGFSFPAAMAFVPEPGPRPEDPLYFVVELRGRLRVVTRDRSVHVFAEGITNFVPRQELPSNDGETGSAGVCVDGETGFVFVTYTYLDEGGEMRNGITRFSTKPGVFSLKPTGTLDLRPVLAADISTHAHQIGPCEVHDGHVYVGVGDGHEHRRARDLKYTNGKILRMTLDGRPVPGNPHFTDDGVDQAADYVFASGLRNPFGLRWVGDRLLVADNGQNMDRFVEVRAGDDLLWNGSDWTSASRADLVFADAVAPVGFDVSVAGTPFPEDWRDHVFIAAAGSSMDPPGPSSMNRRSVLSFAWDLERRKARSVPAPFLRYRGFGVQLPLEAVFGPDGLYVVSLMPDAEGSASILRIAYDPDRTHPHVISPGALLEMRPRELLMSRGCNGCHGSDQPGRTIAPPLRGRKELANRIATRLRSEEYATTVRELDARTGEFWQTTRPWREEVAAAQGSEQVKRWIFYHLLKPKFDNPSSAMPDLGLTRSEAQALAEFLGRRRPDPPPPPPRARRLSEIVGTARWAYVGVAVVAGLLGGLAIQRLLGRRG